MIGVHDDVERREQLSTRDLVRWSETLAAIARTGLGFTQNLYERERFEEVLRVAADIKMAANEVLLAAEERREHDHLVEEWMESIGVDVPGLRDAEGGDRCGRRQRSRRDPPRAAG